jgi:hypothetical protein
MEGTGAVKPKSPGPSNIPPPPPFPPEIRVMTLPFILLFSDFFHARRFKNTVSDTLNAEEGCENTAPARADRIEEGFHIQLSI